MIKKLTNKIIEKLITEIKQPEHMKKLQINILDPMIDYTYRRLYPYFLVTTIVFLLTFILALLIFCILLRQVLKKCD